MPTIFQHFHLFINLFLPVGNDGNLFVDDVVFVLVVFKSNKVFIVAAASRVYMFSLNAHR